MLSDVEEINNLMLTRLTPVATLFTTNDGFKVMAYAKYSA